MSLPARSVASAALVTASIVLGACRTETAIPIDPANPPTTGAIDLTDVTHQLEPTAAMREAAEQQCRDDPDAVEGYVEAVDPRTDAIMASVTVDCAEVRAGE